MIFHFLPFNRILVKNGNIKNKIMIADLWNWIAINITKIPNIMLFNVLFLKNSTAISSIPVAQHCLKRLKVVCTYIYGLATKINTHINQYFSSTFLVML
jgi:hypothetical protein